MEQRGRSWWFGNPDLAATFARDDAIIDHDRDGVWAEMFLAAVKSALFGQNVAVMLCASLCGVL